MPEAFLSLGSNLGNRFQNIQSAITSIKNLSKTKVIKVSNYYETEPFGVPDKQNKYINCCVKIDTLLSPQELLKKCMQIELSLGRTREYRFCPRTIDIDILIYENKIIDEPNLTLPHPRMLERAFVLKPLLEIYKDQNLNIYLNKCDLSTIKLINYF